MKKSFKFYSKTFFKKNLESGFTLIEIIMAIVIIGIAVPSIMVPFSGLSDTKGPEYIVQASFLAQERMELLANEDTANILNSCPNSPTSISVPNLGPGTAYTVACTSVQVNATDPDTSATSTFAQKVTMTITRADMDDLTFNQLFAAN